MNSNIPDLTLDLPRLLAKRPRVNKSRKLPEETNSIGTHTPSPAREIPLMKNEKEIIFPILKPEPELEPKQLSRLRKYSILIAEEDPRSSRLRESFAAEAQSVKKTLISSLTSAGDADNMDVDFMIDLANVAFESLSSFRAKFGRLYDAVKIFISYHCRLLETKDALKKNGCISEMLARKASLAGRSREAANAMRKRKAELAHASSNVAVLKAQAEEARQTLSQIEGKLAKASEEVAVLRMESNKLEKTYEDARTEYQCFTKTINEKIAAEHDINNRRDRIVASIHKLKGTLCTLYWSDFDK